MPRNRIGRLNIITSVRWHREDLDSDSDSSSSSDISSASSVSSGSSQRSLSPASTASFRSGNSAGSGGRHSVHSNHSNSDNSDAGNNSDSGSSARSAHSNRSSINIDSDNSNSPGSHRSHNSDDDDNSDLSIGGSGEDQLSPPASPIIYDSDDSDNFGPSLAHANLGSPPAPPSPSSSDRSIDIDSDRSNSGSDSILGGIRRLVSGVRSLPSPSEYEIVGSPAFSEVVRIESDTSDNDTGSFHSAERIMTASSVSRNSTRASTISFECSVCLENLDAPASIDDVVQGNADPENNQVNPAVGTSRGGGSRGGGRGGRRGASQRNNTPPTLTDVVATHCGHLYHQVCLEKWFTEQGKRSCPSCRKNVPPTKQFRLYPNFSVDSSRNRNGPSPDINMPGPSSASAPAANPVPIASEPVAQPQVVGPSTNNGNGDCTKPECQDMKMIHNTLINDYNDLQERFDDLRENDELKEAQIRSLEEDNARQYDEIQRLKRQVQDVGSSPAGGSATKRRRQ